VHGVTQDRVEPEVGVGDRTLAGSDPVVPETLERVSDDLELRHRATGIHLEVDRGAEHSFHDVAFEVHPYRVSGHPKPVPAGDAKRVA
jgi:hypothetical protein